MCMNIEIASIIFEICIVPEPATTSGTGLLLDRDTGLPRATGNIDPLNNRGSLFYKCNIPIHLTRKTPIGSATTVMRVSGT